MTSLGEIAQPSDYSLTHTLLAYWRKLLASWPGTYHLVGFTYHSLSGDENLDRRLEWISNSKPFSPHVYTQLAEVYRRSGHEGFARQVSIEREKSGDGNLI